MDNGATLFLHEGLRPHELGATAVAKKLKGFLKRIMGERFMDLSIPKEWQKVPVVEGLPDFNPKGVQWLAFARLPEGHPQLED